MCASTFWLRLVQSGVSCCFRKFLAAAGLKTFDHHDADYVGLHFAAAVGAVGVSCCFRKFLADAGLKTFDHHDTDHVGLHFAAAVGAVGFSCCFRKFLADAGLRTFDHQDADHVGLHFAAAVGAVGVSCCFRNFFPGEEISGFLAGKLLRNLRDLSHSALYFGAELSVVADPAFHAGEDIQFACEW